MWDRDHYFPEEKGPEPQIKQTLSLNLVWLARAIRWLIEKVRRRK